jgi:hypothetical protein
MTRYPATQVLIHVLRLVAAFAFILAGLALLLSFLARGKLAGEMLGNIHYMIIPLALGGLLLLAVAEFLRMLRDLADNSFALHSAISGLARTAAPPPASSPLRRQGDASQATGLDGRTDACPACGGSKVLPALPDRSVDCPSCQTPAPL